MFFWDENKEKIASLEKRVELLEYKLALYERNVYKKRGIPPPPDTESIIFSFEHKNSAFDCNIIKSRISSADIYNGVSLE